MPPRRKSIPDLEKRLEKISLEMLKAANPSEAARILGLPERTYRNWMGGQAPSSPELLAFADLGVNLNWLLTGDGPMMLADIAPPQIVVRHSGEIPVGDIVNLVTVPILDDPVAAGRPLAVREARAEDIAVVHRRWCPHPGDSFMVRIEGDSMEPTIPNASLVLVDTADREHKALIGQPVLLWHEGGVSAKRLYRCDRDTWIGVPDNLTKDNRPRILREEEGDAVIGRIRSVHAEVK